MARTSIDTYLSSIKSIPMEYSVNRLFSELNNNNNNIYPEVIIVFTINMKKKKKNSV